MNIGNINGQGINFYPSAGNPLDESGVPEPQSLEENYGKSPAPVASHTEMDAMYDLILSEKQEDKNKFAQQYVQRKVDRKIKEIEKLSNEKKRRGYLDDAQVVLKTKIDQQYGTENKTHYNVFYKTPDPAYLRSKADVMTNAEVLKQRMKRGVINQKADQIVRNYFDDINPKGKKRKAGRKKKKLVSENRQEPIEVMPEISSTVDMRVVSDFTSSEDINQRMSTLGNESSRGKINFHDSQGKAIMQVGI